MEKKFKIFINLEEMNMTIKTSTADKAVEIARKHLLEIGQITKRDFVTAEEIKY